VTKIKGVFGLREINRKEKKTQISINEFGLKGLIVSLKSVFFSLP
jgi:hypothetical protein